jgi:hypothetical protein
MDLTHWIAEGRRAAESDRETCARGAYPVPADEAEARSDLAYWIRCAEANERALAALSPDEQKAALDAAWSAYAHEWPEWWLDPAVDVAAAAAPACSSCGSYPAATGARMCSGCAGTGLDQHEAFAG